MLPRHNLLGPVLPQVPCSWDYTCIPCTLPIAWIIVKHPLQPHTQRAMKSVFVKMFQWFLSLHHWSKLIVVFGLFQRTGQLLDILNIFSDEAMYLLNSLGLAVRVSLFSFLSCPCLLRPSVWIKLPAATLLLIKPLIHCYYLELLNCFSKFIFISWHLNYNESIKVSIFTCKYIDI